MNWQILISTVVPILITLILFYLIKNYFPAYFTEKGKNVATKEDIEEITEKIKTVESKINIQTSGKIDYNSLKRKVILDYFGVYNHWERLVALSEANYENDCDIKNALIIEKLYEAKFNYNLKEGEIEVFISEDSFYNARKDLTITLLKLQQEFEIHLMLITKIIKTVSDPILRKQQRDNELTRYNTLLIHKLKEIRTFRNVLILYLEKTLQESFN
ncbi:hypothetical protein [Chryseobacterium sp. AG363]|uniref:hypothetical protein n=1 Tax=Chryseobacterium sp. AG363 TaxID=2183997 RepID=UPI000E76E4AE|nr:hypothetical protein [Chryseobacterium sp. AG363]RKE77849.1 hypothetical protein DEU39_3482 [Chryseobacterium sp. AG363]